MDSVDIAKEVNIISKRVNEQLSDFYESLKNDVAMNKAKAKSGKDNSRQVKVCPIIQQIEPMSESERQIATSTIANIEKVVKDNPNEFGGKDISETSYTGGSKGTGDGTGRETELISVGMPKWIQEIENSVKAKFKRKKADYVAVPADIQQRLIAEHKEEEEDSHH